MSVFAKFICLICTVFILSSCDTTRKVIKSERDNRGGASDYLADKALPANTHKMRVLRAYAVTAAMSGLALETGLDDSERDVTVTRIRTTMRFLKNAKDCAHTHPDCIYIDTRMFEVNKSLFLLAKTTLPIDDLKELLDLSSLGLSTIRALLRLSGKAVKGGLRVAAIYRDTWDLYMIVYRDHLTKIIANTQNQELKKQYQSAKDKLDDLYQSGSGDLRQWKNLIRDHKVHGDSFKEISFEVEPEDKHFKTVIKEIKSNCERLAEKTDKQSCDFKH